MHLWLHPWLLV
jgi:hypothetical protein